MENICPKCKKHVNDHDAYYLLLGIITECKHCQQDLKDLRKEKWTTVIKKNFAYNVFTSLNPIDGCLSVDNLAVRELELVDPGKYLK